MQLTAPNGKVFSLRCDCDYSWAEDDKDSAAIMVDVPRGTDLCHVCGHYGWTMTEEKAEAIKEAFKQLEEKS